MNFKNWKEYFHQNRFHFDWVNWEKSDRINYEEKRAILTSIQQFQKGENSEGKNLIHYAREYGDLDYLETIKTFIREEQTHALVLGKFMQLNNIDKIKEHWIDTVFRSLRKLAKLENSIIVLLTAEIIAAVYYKALRDATGSKTLKSICNRILIDEEMHINFQAFTLKNFYHKKSNIGKLLSRTLHSILMAGTTVVVWVEHKKVLKKGNYEFLTFWQEIFEEFDRAEKMIIGIAPIHILVTETMKTG